MTKCLTCGVNLGAGEGCGDVDCPYDRSLPTFEAGTSRGFAEQTKVDADADAEADAKRSSREIVARFMLTNGFATGHGDTLYDLLRELERQVNELKRAAK